MMETIEIIGAALPFTLRQPKREDARSILECHRASIEGKALLYYGEKIVHSWKPEIKEDLIKKVQMEISEPDWIYVVAESEEGIIGFGIVIPENHELRAVYVRPNHSGQVGTKLLNELLKGAQSKGLTYLKMDASANAEQFYQRNGFKTLSQGTHVLNSGDEMACVTMRIDL